MESLNKKEQYRKAGMFLIVFSSIAIVITVLIIAESYFFCRNGTFATGQVVGYLEANKTDKHLIFKPIIEYKIDTKVVKIEGNTYENKEDVYQIGEEVSICYNTKYPQNSRLASFKEMYQVKLIILGVLFLMLIIGIYQYNGNKD